MRKKLFRKGLFCMDINYIDEWFQYADDDLESAEFLQRMHKQPLHIICYHCQQSAEKYLKGYLFYSGIVDVPKTHDLVILREKCEEFDEHFSNIEHPCGVLTKYGVQPRYPRELKIENNDMQKALKYAQQIRDFEPLMQVRQKIALELSKKAAQK